jgi:hypothetical protein
VRVRDRFRGTVIGIRVRVKVRVRVRIGASVRARVRGSGLPNRDISRHFAVRPSKFAQTFQHKHI